MRQSCGDLRLVVTTIGVEVIGQGSAHLRTGVERFLLRVRNTAKRDQGASAEGGAEVGTRTAVCVPLEIVLCFW